MIGPGVAASAGPARPPPGGPVRSTGKNSRSSSSLDISALRAFVHYGGKNTTGPPSHEGHDFLNFQVLENLKPLRRSRRLFFVKLGAESGHQHPLSHPTVLGNLAGNGYGT